MTGAAGSTSKQLSMKQRGELTLTRSVVNPHPYHHPNPNPHTLTLIP